ncbi:MAG: RnfABCDGE type electron transport complex subunit G [Clostridia bacterium]|nr:RnfABCDGE type electron transport complex subunit G [Clostridia bacterium]
MRDNEKSFVLAAVLFVITAVVSLMLAFSNMVTADKIAENTKKAENEARVAVMPEATDFKFFRSYREGIVTEVQRAVRNDEKIGWCAKVSPNGYGGAIEFIVGIDNDFKITGIKIVNMSETPGLGAKAGEEKFSSQFPGKYAKDGLSVIKSGTPKENEILAISGATVTSSAIKEGINAAIEAVKGGIRNERIH